MMKNKTFLRLVVAAWSLLIGISSSAFEIDGLTYTINSDGQTVTVSKGTKTSGTLSIPETVTYNGNTYSVTTIGNYAFQRCDGFTGSLTIPNSVTTISGCAFSDCSGLTSLTIPTSLTSIGRNAFSGCTGLTAVTWNAVKCYGPLPYALDVPSLSDNSGLNVVKRSTPPRHVLSYSYVEEYFFIFSQTKITSFTFGSKVQRIPEYVCAGIKTMSSVTIPNSVTTIGEGAFANCIGLTSITIPNSVTAIEGGDLDSAGAFEGCIGLSTIAIPNSVTSIGSWAFCGCSGLTSLTIPNSVTSIGDEAFCGCSGLTSLTIPNSVTSIGYEAFGGCTGLTSLTIPNSVTTIGSEAFGGCSGLIGSLTIPESLTSIGDCAFSGCSGLTSVKWNAKNCAVTYNWFVGPFYGLNNIKSFVFGDAVETIPSQLCEGLTGLTSLTIPNSVTSIGWRAFGNCSGMTGSLTIPNSVTSIGGNAFEGCSGFTGSLTIGNSVTTIGNSAFSGCSGFTGSLTIGNTVTTIGNSAFSGCSGFTGSLTIPKSVTTIGDGAFSSCTGLESINVELSNPNYDSRNNCNAIIETASDKLISGCSNTVIPNTVISINGAAFLGYKELTTVTIPASVSSIGNFAFGSCGLKHIYSHILNPENVTMGTNVFSNVDKVNCCLHVPNGTVASYSNSEQWKDFIIVTGDYFQVGELSYEVNSDKMSVTVYSASHDLQGDLKIPSTIVHDGVTYSVTVIGEKAFYNCVGMTSVTIPSTIESIGSYAFSGCSGLTSVTIPNSVTSIGSYAFSGCSGLTSVKWNAKNCADFADYAPFGGLTNIKSFVFGDAVETIPSQLCEGLTGLTGSLTIPNSVTSVGGSAFSGCSGLTGSLVIPNSVTVIGENAFSGCIGLTSLTIGSVVKNIGKSAFSGCRGLKGSLVIPNSVTYIDNEAFSGCTGFDGTLTIGNKVWGIANDAFNNCRGFTSIELSNSVTTIGAYAFYNCKGLKDTLLIPNSTKTIGNYAFYGCSGLTTLTLPESLTSIGWYAFCECSGLTAINNHIGHPSDVKLGYGVFDYVSKTNCILYVNKGKVQDYRKASQWGAFRNILEGSWSLVPATGITLNRSYLRLQIGESYALTATITPDNADNKGMSWASSNTAVATVSNNGVVIAKSDGSATITVTTVDGSNLSAICNVTVGASTNKTGDINGDDIVDVSDVNMIIDIVLGKAEIDVTIADLNGDRIVDVTDVNMLIDIILGKTPNGGNEPETQTYTVNGVTFKMVEIKGGTFQMGGTAEQQWVQDDEKPVHQVTVSDFCLGQTEVTQELWKAVMGYNPSKFRAANGYEEDFQRPVEMVTREDAMTFISRLNELTGESFRLPTEAEWEYAARGGNRSRGTMYAGGNDPDPVAWCAINSGKITHAVGTKLSNELGLYDMSGNVYEWCSDFFGDYSSTTQVNPTGPTSGDKVVVRGASWYHAIKDCRVSARLAIDPARCYDSIGVRLAK